MLSAFLTSLIFVVLAEMADKTQLLAMAFACKYRWQTVLWGVFVATAFNHLLAAYAGYYLTHLIPLDYIKIIASASFVIFGIWTIRGDSLEGEDKKYNLSPFWTVTIAFFIAEMADKTQLATISLAVQFGMVIVVWIGTTIGMVISNAFAIIVGNVLKKTIPATAIKWTSAMIFIGFGLYSLTEVVPIQSWPPQILVLSAISLIAAIAIAIKTSKPQTTAHCAFEKTNQTVIKNENTSSHLLQ